MDLSWILKSHGILRTARWLRRSVPYYLWFHFTTAGRQERNFDQIHGVETEGIMPRGEMGDVGPNRRFAVQYSPTKPKMFYRLLDSLPINYSDFTFIDIGAGKGRVLLMASRYPFRRIVGVEFVPKLCEIAHKNSEICGSPVEIHCMDATQYVFADDPLVIYMFNPFGMEPMQKIAHNLEESLAARPRPVYLVYWNPSQLRAFAGSPYFAQVVFKRDEFAIFRSTTVVHDRSVT
jgi:hypothetical protein